MLFIRSLSMTSKMISHTSDIELLHTLSVTLLFGGALVISAIILFLGMRTIREEQLSAEILDWNFSQTNRLNALLRSVVQERLQTAETFVRNSPRCSRTAVAGDRSIRR